MKRDIKMREGAGIIARGVEKERGMNSCTYQYSRNDGSNSFPYAQRPIERVCEPPPISRSADTVVWWNQEHFNSDEVTQEVRHQHHGGDGSQHAKVTHQPPGLRERGVCV